MAILWIVLGALAWGALALWFILRLARASQQAIAHVLDPDDGAPVARVTAEVRTDLSDEFTRCVDPIDEPWADELTAAVDAERDALFKASAELRHADVFLGAPFFKGAEYASLDDTLRIVRSHIRRARRMARKRRRLVAQRDGGSNS